MKKESEAIKLAKVMNSKETMRSVTGLLSGAIKDIPMEALKKLTAIFTREKNMKEMINESAAIYLKYYTPSEIKALIKFYSSKVGKKHRDTSLQTMSEVIAIGQKWGQKIITENMDEIKSILEESDSKKMESNGIDKSMQKRLEFAASYAISKGWNMKDLTVEQLLEIREQDGWKNTGEKS